MSRFATPVTVLVLTLAAAALLPLAGCEKPEESGPAKLVFYPTPPDPPRYQFLTSFSDIQEWIKPTQTSLKDWIVGGPTESEQAISKIKNPYGVACHQGKLYICDLGLTRLDVIDLVKGTYTTLGDKRTLPDPMSIEITPDGTKYVCDKALKQIVVFDANDQFVSALGDPKACTPSDVAVGADELYVVDQLGAKVQVWSRDGQLKRVIGGVDKNSGQLIKPVSIVLGQDNQLFVSDMIANTIFVFDTQGKYLRKIGAPGDTTGHFARIKGMCLDPAGRLYVADSTWDTLQIFTQDGQLLLAIRDLTETPHQMTQPTWVAADGSPATMEVFRKYAAPGFDPQFVVFVSNEFGKNKITVLAYGEGRLQAVPVPAAAPTTQPASAD
ncbi:MAG: hypothetical protein BIFFINMI_03147 [Phycisphaerae bacterium]|nr:hypothetical protein [Phycisphaerae bacterium]